MFSYNWEEQHLKRADDAMHIFGVSFIALLYVTAEPFIQASESQIWVSMRQVGRKSRAFLYVVLKDCYELYYHASTAERYMPEKKSSGTWLPDARYHRLFWRFMLNFKRSVLRLKKTKKDDHKPQNRLKKQVTTLITE